MRIYGVQSLRRRRNSDKNSILGIPRVNNYKYLLIYPQAFLAISYSYISFQIVYFPNNFFKIGKIQIVSYIRSRSYST